MKLRRNLRQRRGDKDGMFIFNFLRKVYRYKAMIWAMSIREVQSRYIGTVGGMLWSIINPLMMILVYWFVFSVGFKVQTTSLWYEKAVD